MDIIRVIRDMNRKANSILCTFGSVDPFVKSFCLSLYGCTLWKLSTSSLKLIEISLNKLLRKVWNLPYNSHTSIVHCVARTSSISNIVYNRFLSMYSRALSNCSSLVRLIFTHASQLVYTFSGYNHVYGHTHLRYYSDIDVNTASIIRHFRSFYGLYIFAL